MLQQLKSMLKHQLYTKLRSENVPNPNGWGETFLLLGVVPKQDGCFSEPAATRWRSFMCNAWWKIGKRVSWFHNLRPTYPFVLFSNYSASFIYLKKNCFHRALDQIEWVDGLFQAHLLLKFSDTHLHSRSSKSKCGLKLMRIRWWGPGADITHVHLWEGG